MALRSQNYSYVAIYLKQAAATGVMDDDPAINFLRIIYDVSCNPDYQPGALLYAGEDNEVRKLLKKYNFISRGGFGEATWCTYVVYHILKSMGYNIFPILDQVYHDIAYTTAREMYDNAKANQDACIEINWKEAIAKANAGIPILVAAIGRGKNQCHVAIVAPQYCNLDKMRVIDCIVGQGGYYNGFGTIGDFFNKAYVYEPSFFELKKV